MEIIENAHSVPASDTGISEKASQVYKGEKPMNTNEAVEKPEPALSIYERIKGVPYTIVYNDMPISDDKTIEMAQAVDNFVIKEIGRKKLTDSIESYHSIIEQLKGVLKIDMNAQSTSVLEKLFKYVKRYRGASAYKK